MRYASLGAVFRMSRVARLPFDGSSHFDQSRVRPDGRFQASQSLSPSHREVLLLRDLEDLTIGEIAGRLGVTREAAKSRLRRARTLVREYLLGTKDSGREST